MSQAENKKLAMYGLCLAKETVHMVIANEGVKCQPRSVPSNAAAPLKSNTTARSTNLPKNVSTK